MNFQAVRTYRYGTKPPKRAIKKPESNHCPDKHNYRMVGLPSPYATDQDSRNDCDDDPHDDILDHHGPNKKGLSLHFNDPECGNTKL
jgi:hypothetical protein